MVASMVRCNHLNRCKNLFLSAVRVDNQNRHSSSRSGSDRCGNGYRTVGIGINFPTSITGISKEKVFYERDVGACGQVCGVWGDGGGVTGSDGGCWVGDIVVARMVGGVDGDVGSGVFEGAVGVGDEECSLDPARGGDG
ncbi:hypothetical protein GCM10027580_15080 [Corynebacterium faecale]